MVLTAGLGGRSMYCQMIATIGKRAEPLMRDMKLSTATGTGLADNSVNLKTARPFGRAVQYWGNGYEKGRPERIFRNRCRYGKKHFYAKIFDLKHRTGN